MTALNQEQAAIFYRQLDALNRRNLEKFMTSRRRLEKIGVKVESIKGNTPIIVEGTLGKRRRFFLRLRGDYWYFHVYYMDMDLYQNDVFVAKGLHGYEDQEGGWLLKHQVLHCLERAIEGFRLKRPENN